MPRRVATIALFFVACQAPTLELVVPLAAIDWSPQDGASGVCPSWPVSVCFNQPIDPNSLGDFLIGPAKSCVSGAAIGSALDVSAFRADTLTPGASPNCVVLPPPTAGWSFGTCYAVEAEGADLVGDGGVTGEVGDAGTDVLAVTLRSLFEVAPTSAGCIAVPDAG
jgi:hypothetical protein